MPVGTRKSARTKSKVEFGDFQTPFALASDACQRLTQMGVAPMSLLEPSCGRGAFLLAGLDAFPHARQALGIELNAEHVHEANRQLAQREDSTKTRVMVGDIFTTDWRATLDPLPEPLLALGNPPWVTNSQLGVLQSGNSPQKTNRDGLVGLHAKTGKSNFDVSEWLLLRLCEAMTGRHGALAMLCKTSVARKVLEKVWKCGMEVEEASLHAIDARTHFQVAVDATFLVVPFRPGSMARSARVYSNLSPGESYSQLALVDGALVAHRDLYHRWRHLQGSPPIAWRSGIKHDCAPVMELRREGDRFRNGLGQLVELEETYLYPLDKSSQWSIDAPRVDWWMLVPQSRIGDDTGPIERLAPQTWRYLKSHAERLAARGSSIYRKRPPYSIFGVGPYSFAPWKVAISGFQKEITFQAIGPRNGKPVMLDDTCYFLPLESGAQATRLASRLNRVAAREFYEAFVFWNAKRPITAELLNRLDFRRLDERLDGEEAKSEID